MAKEITDKEHTWLMLKWGPNAYVDLAVLSAGGARGLTEVERRAAIVGEQIQKELQEETFRVFSEEIRKEIDNEIIKTITQQAQDEDN